MQGIQVHLFSLNTSQYIDTRLLFYSYQTIALSDFDQILIALFPVSVTTMMHDLNIFMLTCKTIFSPAFISIECIKTTKITYEMKRTLSIITIKCKKMKNMKKARDSIYILLVKELNC